MCILSCLLGEDGRTHSPHFSQFLSHVSHVGWFVAFAAVRLRRQERGVGFHQDTIVGHFLGDFAQVVGFFEGDGTVKPR
jgi:hypothetical protein